VPLSKSDWIEEALAVLACDGLAAVAVEPLARRLHTTKGSFYWHFANRAELVAATLELWERRATSETIERIEAIADPRERLSALATGAYTRASRGNAYSALLAAASDPPVRALLERVTRAHLGFLERLYRDLGVPADQVAPHARLAYSVYLGISQLRMADPALELEARERESYLDLAVASIMPPDPPA
jgi:AcrR family transcriptional regulator